MKVYAIANQKGGIGKTTTALAISSILTKKGYKTLLIDLDEQGNTTDTMKAEIEGKATIYDVLMGEHIPLRDAVQHNNGIDIVPSDPLLREADARLSQDPEGEFRLLNAIEELEGYDYVVIDTAPSLNMTLRNALIAATDLIIPVTTDRYAIQGMSLLNDVIKAIKKRQNRNLNIAGLLIIKYNERTILGRDVEKSLDDIAVIMDTKVFKTKIRESVKTREAQAKRMNLIDYAPSSTTAIDYKHFIRELLGE